MTDRVWLMGVYRGELVTANDYYVKEIWTQLPAIRRSSFLEQHKSRTALIPLFFFLKPVEKAGLLGEFNPADYGLLHVAYCALKWEEPTRKGAVTVSANGFVSGDCFVVDGVDADVLHAISGLEEKVCVLSLVNAKPFDTPFACARTGTFFNYRIEGKRIKFMPLQHDKGYLVGKGVLEGAWSHVHSWEPLGAMDRWECIRERYCPLTIGGSFFRRNGKSFYIAYRRVKTDLRMDMPAVFLYLNRVGGFEHFAKNFGKSINYAFGKYLGGIDQRNILADGNIVDYADINENKSGVQFDISEYENYVETLVRDVFLLLFLCASVSARGHDTFKMLKGRKKFVEFAENSLEVCRRYHVFRTEFLSGLEKKNRRYFGRLDGVNAMLASVLRENWP